MRRAEIDLAEVRQRVADGANSRAIAAEVGATYASVYLLCDREGIAIRGRGVPNRPHENIDTAIADMRPTEALQYVLEAFKQQTGQDDATLAHGASLGLSASEAMVFGMLGRYEGRFVTTQRLATFLDVSQPGIDRDTLGVVRSYILKLRRKLAGRYIIRSARGQGYMMERLS